jgi:hypothetical protein
MKRGVTYTLIGLLISLAAFSQKKAAVHRSLPGSSIAPVGIVKNITDSGILHTRLAGWQEKGITP